MPPAPPTLRLPVRAVHRPSRHSFRLVGVFGHSRPAVGVCVAILSSVPRHDAPKKHGLVGPRAPLAQLGLHLVPTQPAAQDFARTFDEIMFCVTADALLISHLLPPFFIAVARLNY